MMEAVSGKIIWNNPFYFVITEVTTDGFSI